MELTAEAFLRDKLESEISSFGDGMKEFHTRDVQHLLQCLHQKDERTQELLLKCANLIEKINFNAEEKLKDLLIDCMTINNLSAEQRLSYIRKEYKLIFEKLVPTT